MRYKKERSELRTPVEEERGETVRTKREVARSSIGGGQKLFSPGPGGCAAARGKWKRADPTFVASESREERSLGTVSLGDILSV